MRIRSFRVLCIATLCATLVACNNDRRGSGAEGAGEPDIGPTPDAQAGDASRDTDRDTDDDTDDDTGTQDVASSDVTPDTSSDDASSDATIDVPLDIDADATDAPTLDVPADASVASLDDALFAYVTEVGGRQELRLQQGAFGATPYTLFRDEAGDAFLPAFSPSGERVAFLFQTLEGPVSIRVADALTGESFVVEPEIELRSPLEVTWVDESSIYVPAFFGDHPRTAILQVNVDSGATSVVAADEGAHLREPRPFDPGMLYLRFDDPPVGRVYRDGFGGMAPYNYVDPGNLAQDVRLHERRLYYTDTARRMHAVDLDSPDPGFPIAGGSPVTPEGVQDFHPVPIAGTRLMVTSRYPPELSVRPAPRDIYVVDLDTGEVVRNLSDSLTVPDRHPTVVLRN